MWQSGKFSNAEANLVLHVDTKTINVYSRLRLPRNAESMRSSVLISLSTAVIVFAGFLESASPRTAVRSGEAYWEWKGATVTEHSTWPTCASTISGPSTSAEAFNHCTGSHSGLFLTLLWQFGLFSLLCFPGCYVYFLRSLQKRINRVE